MPKGCPFREPGPLLKMCRYQFWDRMFPVMGFPYLLESTWSLFLGQQEEGPWWCLHMSLKRFYCGHEYLLSMTHMPRGRGGGLSARYRR